MAHVNQTVYSKRDVENALDYLSGRSYDTSLVKPWYNDCRVEGNKLLRRFGQDWLVIVPYEEINNVLRQFLENPIEAKFSRNRINEVIKTRYIGISKRDIESWLRNQEF